MKKEILVSASLLIAFVIVGCRSQQEAKTPYDRPLLPGQPALRKITNPHEIPDFTMACLDLADLRAATLSPKRRGTNFSAFSCFKSLPVSVTTLKLVQNIIQLSL